MERTISYKRSYNQNFYNPTKSNNDLEKLIKGKKHFWSTTGRNALLILFDLLNFKKGDIIMIPALVAHGVVLPIKRRGLIPLYYKSNEDLSPDIDDIKAKMKNKKVVAIFLIHYFGYPQDYEVIFELARKNNVYTIEDCAQALFSSYKNGKIIGTNGDFSLFSLTKFLPVPDGSLIVVNNPTLSIDLNNIQYKFSPLSYLSVKLARVQLKLTTKQLHCKNKLIWKSLDFLYKVVGQFHYLFICSVKKHVNISQFSKKLLHNLDIENMMERRKSNGHYLNKNLRDTNYKFYRPMNEVYCLTGLPLLFSNRSKAKKYFLKLNIKTLSYTKSWWFIEDNDLSSFENEYTFFQNHLLLPVSENLDLEQLNYIINKLKLPAQKLI